MYRFMNRGLVCLSLVCVWQSSSSAYADPRSPSQLQKLSRRSINLAISSRALMAIKSIDSDDGLLYHRLITDATIPMKGRMIHSLDGSLDSQIYSNNGEARLWLCSLEMSHSPIVHQCNRPSKAQQRTHFSSSVSSQRFYLL